MPLAARQECRIFSILALALFFISQTLGIYMTHSYRVQQPWVLLNVAVYYASAFGFALFLFFLFPAKTRAGHALRSPVPLFLALCTVLAFTGHVLGLQGHIPAFFMRAAAVGVFALAALHAFFLFAPPRHKGLLLGLAVAAGELVWLVVLPVMGADMPPGPNPVLIRHLHMIQMTLQCAIGILLTTAFVIWRKAQADTPPEHAPGHTPDHPVSASTLPLLFTAAALFYIVYGLASGMTFPRVGPGISDRAHFPLLLFLPLAGALLDRGGRGCRPLLLILACLVFAAPLMVCIREAAIREVLYAALCVGRQCLFVATLALAERLMRNRKPLPLPLALATILPAISMIGSAASRLGGETFLAGGLAVALALAFTFLVFRVRSALVALPEMREETAAPMPDTEAQKAPVVHPAFHSERLAAFAATHGLSEQETLVMEMLAQGRSSEEIAGALAVKTSTVRTYVVRLMRKTGTDSRAALMARYAAHHPAAQEAASA